MFCNASNYVRVNEVMINGLYGIHSNLKQKHDIVKTLLGYLK